MARSAASVTVVLCRCDGGEIVDRLELTEPDAVARTPVRAAEPVRSIPLLFEVKIARPTPDSLRERHEW